MRKGAPKKEVRRQIYGDLRKIEGHIEKAAELARDLQDTVKSANAATFKTEHLLTVLQLTAVLLKSEIADELARPGYVSFKQGEPDAKG
jgi:hypothetical protein